MFKIENDNVMYKTPNMVDWIQYGTVLTASIKQETDRSYIYQVLKFNFNTETYELDTTVSDYYLDGKWYEVINGEFEVEKEAIPQPQPTNQEIAQTQLTMMEAMADQYEQNLQNQLTNMEVQATIYEELLAQGGKAI
nr:MAG TPA: hypothetical protein [Caudoviricetes sp.]